MNEKKKFHLGHILSVSHGILMVIGEKYPMNGVYKILNFMTGDNLYTHALPRARRECEPWLKKWHPWLCEINLENINITEKNYEKILKKLTNKYGEYHMVKKVPKDTHEIINPIEELIEIVNKGTKQ